MGLALISLISFVSPTLLGGLVVHNWWNGLLWGSVLLVLTVVWIVFALATFASDDETAKGFLVSNWFRKEIR